MDRESISSLEYKARIERAFLAFAEGQDLQAEQLFHELMTLSSDDSDTYRAWSLYGETLARLGNEDDAWDAFLQSAKIASALNRDLWLAPLHEKLGDLSVIEANWFGALHHYRVARRLAGSTVDRLILETLDAKSNAAQNTLHATILPRDGTILALRHEYVSGNMSISFVHRDIFLKNYFARCLDCSFCHDWCCSFGADVDILNVGRIRKHQEHIKPFIRPSGENWFDEEFDYYEEYAGRQYTRIKTQGPRCVFISKDQRGCGLHRFAISRQMDYHEIKPLVCILFPLSFGEGILRIAPELEDNSLVCAGEGASAYRSLREEVEYYFGHELIEELDQMERKVLEAR
jgi:Fe-S-cluster containining protein